MINIKKAVNSLQSFSVTVVISMYNIGSNQARTTQVAQLPVTTLRWSADHRMVSMIVFSENLLQKMVGHLRELLNIRHQTRRRSINMTHCIFNSSSEATPRQ